MECEGQKLKSHLIKLGVPSETLDDRFVSCTGNAGTNFWIHTHCVLETSCRCTGFYLCPNCERDAKPWKATLEGSTHQTSTTVKYDA